VGPAQASSGDVPAPGEGKKILGYDVFTWQKIIPLGAMFFCILFNYTILRDTKVRAGLCAGLKRTPPTRPGVDGFSIELFRII
jgi:hypothetical protein